MNLSYDTKSYNIFVFRFNVLRKCRNAKTCTFILRGGAEQFLEETERSLHDAIMVVRRMLKNDAIVAGGGSIEMELSKTLRDYSRTIAGKEQLLIGALARALEIIPRYRFYINYFSLTKTIRKSNHFFFIISFTVGNCVIMPVLMQQIF